MKRARPLALAVLVTLVGTANAETPTSAQAPTPTPAQAQVKSEAEVNAVRDQAVQEDLLVQARRMIEEGNTANAVATADKVIGYYESNHPESESRWYVARTPQETLAYMVIAATGKDKDQGKRSATALYAPWADAYYMKAYALVELGQPEDAKAALEHAIHLSPYNSQYLSELGNIYQGEKNWPKTLDLFTRAEGGAAFSPPDQKMADSTRAKRGLGYVLVELGRFDEAEKKYTECLAMDPGDDKSKQELAYVRAVRAKSK